jgi:hypothetical protein
VGAGPGHAPSSPRRSSQDGLTKRVTISSRRTRVSGGIAKIGGSVQHTASSGLR